MSKKEKRHHVASVSADVEPPGEAFRIERRFLVATEESLVSKGAALDEGVPDLERPDAEDLTRRGISIWWVAGMGSAREMLATESFPNERPFFVEEDAAAAAATVGTDVANETVALLGVNGLLLLSGWLFGEDDKGGCCGGDRFSEGRALGSARSVGPVVASSGVRGFLMV